MGMEMKRSVVAKNEQWLEFAEVLDKIIRILILVQGPYRSCLGTVKECDEIPFSKGLNEHLEKLTALLTEINTKWPSELRGCIRVGSILSNLHQGAAKPLLAGLYVEATVRELSIIRVEIERRNNVNRS